MGIVVISNATIPGGTAPPGVPVLLYKQLSGWYETEMLANVELKVSVRSEFCL